MSNRPFSSWMRKIVACCCCSFSSFRGGGAVFSAGPDTCSLSFLPWFKSAIPFQELTLGWGKGEDIFILVSAHIFRKQVSQASMHRRFDFRNVFGFPTKCNCLHHVFHGDAFSNAKLSLICIRSPFITLRSTPCLRSFPSVLPSPLENNSCSAGVVACFWFF